MKKIIVSLVLVFVMSLCAFALTESSFDYEILPDNTVAITYYSGNEKEVAIPENIDGKAVSEISVQVFYNNSDVEKVTLPNTVKRIEYQAFLWCRNLSEINFPASLEYLGERCFQGTSLKTVDLSECTNLDFENPNSYSLFSECESLESVKLPSTCTAIPLQCFDGCKALKSVDFNLAPVRIIKAGAFNECESLENIILPHTVKEIRAVAFGFSGLHEISVPYGTQMLEDAFSGCENLKAVYVPSTVKSPVLINRPGYDGCIVYCEENSAADESCRRYQIPHLFDRSVNATPIIYNGKRINFHSYIQNPELVNSRVYVPVRGLFEAMGAEVLWDDATYTVTAIRGETEIKLRIGESKIYINGVPKNTYGASFISNYRTMIPVRAAAEAFGAEVIWDENGKVVLIKE